MAVSNAGLNELADDTRREFESVLLAFDQSWSEVRLAEQVQSLPPPGDPLRLAVLIELVKVDLERNWQHGRQRRVEDYLADYPELGTPADVAPDLLQTEYEVRQQFGEPAKLADFAARFPLRADALRRLVQEAVTAADSAYMVNPSTVELRTVETSTPVSGLPPEDVLDLPEQFGRYRIVRKLGQGSMGTVYLAHDSTLGRSVALKVPRLALDGERKVLDRFYQEARAAATLEHPHLCPVYDVGEINGTPYLTMAFVEGRPLSEVLRDGPALDVPRVVTLLHQLALALQEAHTRGVVHRDLKPSNVMLNARGEPVVMDFGLARRSEPQEVRLTHNGSLVGTPAYMAPEQVQGKVDDLGPACDIYALGVILYEALTGRLPFQGPLMAVLAQIVNQEPEPLTKLRPELDPALEGICRKAMAKQPEDRYASMSALAADLDAYLHGTGPAGMPATPARTSTGLQPPPRSRRLWIAAGGAAFAAVFLGIIIVIRHPDGTTTTIKTSSPVTIEIQVDPKPPEGTKAANKPPAVPQPPDAHPPGTYALRFDGIRSRVRIPKSSFKYYGDHSLTIEATVIPYAVSSSRQEIMCDLTAGSGISLALRPSRHWTFVAIGTKLKYEVTHESPVVLNQRVQLAAVIDKERRKLRLFVDGKLNNSESEIGAKFRNTSGWDTIIGADPQNPGNRFSNFFNGVVEQIRISKVARYTKDYVPPPVFDKDVDTLILYLCNEGEGGVLRDSSGRGADARLEAAHWVKRKP